MILRCGLRCGGKRVDKWAALVAIFLGANLDPSSASAEDRAVLGAVTPHSIALGEEVTVRWSYEDGDGGSTGRFDIDLYMCDDAFCGQSDCGEFVSNICDKPGIGCVDSNGDYAMTVPTTLTPGDAYKIRVGLHDTDLFDCTSTFTILEDIPVPTLEVYTPVYSAVSGSDYSSADDDHSASEVVETTSSTEQRFRALQSSDAPYFEASTGYAIAANDSITVSWKYDDGMGGSFARFNIDLYYCGGGCDDMNDYCGEAIDRLCEGCPDSSGDEIVTLPEAYDSYNYKIRVSTWTNVPRSVSACSPKFHIVGAAPEYSAPSPTYVADPSVVDPRTIDSPTTSEDLPSTPVVLPTDWPDWGEEGDHPATPDCGNASLPDVRYASTTKRIYVEHNDTRGGCVTLTDIYDGDKLPLYPMDPDTNERVDTVTGVWLLTEELYITDGVTLQVHGTAVGGDCDELRLLSNESTFLNLRAHGGSLSFLGTKVVSWDEGKGTVDTHHEDGRSYISAVSEVLYDAALSCDGEPKSDMGEARMDVIDSEIGYLGFHDSESYGLVWKVRGFCVDKSNPEVFAEVNVYGNIINSDIHHNYFGMYSYGHQGGNWSYNKMHDNVEYGFDPHDDSDYLIIHGNDVWGNGNHGIIASKRCDHVYVTNNHVYDGFNTGLFLHRSSDYAIVTGNHVHSNGDAGLAVLESFYMEISDNVFKNNLYGIRFSVGAGYNWIHDNIVDRSSKYNLFTYLGSDAPDVANTTGFPIGNVFWRNYLSGTQYDGIKLKQGDSNVVVNNRIAGASSIMMDDSDATTYRDNEEEEGMEVEVRGTSCFSDDSEVGPTC